MTDFETASEEYLKRIGDVITRRMGDSAPVDGMNSIPVIIGCGVDCEPDESDEPDELMKAYMERRRRR